MQSWLREVRIPGLVYDRAVPACLFFLCVCGGAQCTLPQDGLRVLVSHFWLLPHPSRFLPVQKEKQASRSHRGQGRTE